jgi:hypothetical protein
VLKLILRAVGQTFYQQHMGLFLVAFYLLFGMIQGQALIIFHISLLISICSSPLNLLVLFVIWLLYSLKCLFFVKQKLGLPEYQFAMAITIKTKQKQYQLWLKIYMFLLMPILIYACFMLLISLKHQLYISFAVTLIAIAVILFLLVDYTFRDTNFSFRTSKNWLILPKTSFKKTFWTWPIFYLLTEQRVMLLICKVVSIVFLKAILLVFADVGNDIRVYLTAILAVVLSHAVLVLNLVKFDAFYLSFAKTLPITALKRLIYWIVIFCLLLVPELILLNWLTVANALELFYCALFAIGAMLFLQTLVYLLKANADRYMQYLLFFFFGAMLAILGGYFILFSVCCLSCSCFMYLVKNNKMDLKELI